MEAKLHDAPKKISSLPPPPPKKKKKKKKKNWAHGHEHLQKLDSAYVRSLVYLHFRTHSS